MPSTPTLRPARGEPPVPTTNGSGAVRAVVPTPPGRRVRVPELVVGVLIAVVFALGAVLWHLSAVQKSPALAMANHVERGDTVTADDIKVAYVASDDTVVRLDESQMDEIVGRMAEVDLAPGTLLTRSAVANGPALKSGRGVVGLELEPGGYPASGLAAGDRVTVVRTTDPAVAGSEGGSGDADAGVLARDVTVYEVEDLTGGRRLVSILAPTDEAESVAAASGTGALRLVMVGS